eukprot:30484_1
MSSSSSFDRITMLLVCGWIRKLEQLLKLGNIPSSISSVCALYHGENEMFLNIYGKNEMVITKKCTCVAKIKGHTKLYGMIEIESNKACICQWNLKINKTISGWIRIGISSNPTSNTFIEDTNGFHYLYSGFGRKYISTGDNVAGWTLYGKQIRDNDKVTILLDLFKATISFSLNDIDQGIACNSIKQDSNVKYRLMVSMYGVNDSANILHFSRKTN